MKTLQEILVELQALATVSEDQFEASLATVVSDLEAVIGATATPATDPFVTLVGTTQSGAVVTFVPQA